ncbi:MAG: leucyl/phenylalanyl-tRNA--protein transferase [Deinococcus sp.]|nr:leucyl/phenylalanyl-tRNA--protein transferase [Deinococcus sp.]
MDVGAVIEGYAQGRFLMDNGQGLRWYSSRRHALIPLAESLHIPRSLKKTLQRGLFQIRINGDFLGTVAGCGARKETWISDELKSIYLALYRAGYAHSFEAWQGGRLAGGVLGIAIGGAFIGESMFYRVPEASKVALVYLARHLCERGYLLFDAQIQNPHLERFGAYEVDEPAYKKLLQQALAARASFV